MQFGIFSVSDITRDPVSGQTPSEAERIDAIVKIAQKTEEVGMDVFAIGEHHNPPFFSSSPTTLLAYIAATTQKLLVTTATTLITTNDPVRIAEEYAMTPDWDNRERTGGSVDEIIAESRINAKWILEGVRRFVTERPARLKRLRESLPE